MTTYEVIKIFVCHTKDLFQLQTTDVSFKKEKREQKLLHKKKRKRSTYFFFWNTFIKGRAHTEPLWSTQPWRVFLQVLLAWACPQAWMNIHNAWLMLLMAITSPRGVWREGCCWAGRPRAIPKGKDMQYPLWKAEKRCSSQPSLWRAPKSSRPDCQQPSLLKVIGFLPLKWINAWQVRRCFGKELPPLGHLSEGHQVNSF